MVRYSYEEIVWEGYSELGEELLDTLNIEDRELVQRAFGLFPYQPHSIRAIAKLLNIPHSTANFRYRKIIRTLKKTILNLQKD